MPGKPVLNPDITLDFVKVTPRYRTSRNPYCRIAVGSVVDFAFADERVQGVALVAALCGGS